MKSIAAAALLLLVSGCVSSSPTPPPASPIASGANKPYPLSDTEKATIEAGVRVSGPNIAADAAFRTITATKGTNGITTACGYVGTSAGEKPFIGVLGGTGFAMTGIGGAAEETIAVQTSCGQLGIHI